MADWDADRALTVLYGAHYPPLVRLASLLVQDTATAEEVVQDSFVALRACPGAGCETATGRCPTCVSPW